MSTSWYDHDAAARLRRTLDRFPRVPVAYLPTPLDDCPRLSDAVGGPRLLMKRDDLTGLAFGGNKARQFTFSLAPAVRDGCDVLVHGAAAQSNQSRQTAAAAAKLGMKAVVIIPREPRSYPVQGNLLLDHLLGAEVRYVFPEMAREAKQQAIDELKAQGHKPYETSSDGAILRAVAYVECVLELCDQLDRLDVIPSAVYVCSGVHTVVGLTVGLRAIGAPFRTVAISPYVGQDEEVRERLVPVGSECAATLDLDLTFSPDDFEVYCEYAKPDYGVLTKTGLEAIRVVARTEGILLDPSYTGKAMSGLIDHIQKGRFRKDETVVFVHTGGSPALFAYSAELFQ